MYAAGDSAKNNEKRPLLMHPVDSHFYEFLELLSALNTAAQRKKYALLGVGCVYKGERGIVMWLLILKKKRGNTASLSSVST